MPDGVKARGSEVRMSITEAVSFLRSVATPPWPGDRASGEAMLARLGLAPTGPAKDQHDGYFSFGLSGTVEAANNFTFSTHQGDFVSIIFFMASSPAPNDPITRRTYDALCALMSEEFGIGNRVWADEETPLRWGTGDLDIEVQLFDRRDSQVMVSIEHRERSRRLDEAVLANSSTRDQ